MANRVAYDSLQLHGGYGYLEEYPISRAIMCCRKSNPAYVKRIITRTTTLMTYSVDFGVRNADSFVFNMNVGGALCAGLYYPSVYWTRNLLRRQIYHRICSCTDDERVYSFP
ncbi:UNVERIFIED_CONTAM: hypothetical protein ABID98_001829 [Brevibacillus sp. OAP136]